MRGAVVVHIATRITQLEIRQPTTCMYTCGLGRGIHIYRAAVAKIYATAYVEDVEHVVENRIAAKRAALT